SRSTSMFPSSSSATRTSSRKAGTSSTRGRRNPASRRWSNAARARTSWSFRGAADPRLSVGGADHLAERDGVVRAVRGDGEAGVGAASLAVEDREVEAQRDAVHDERAGAEHEGDWRGWLERIGIVGEGDQITAIVVQEQQHAALIVDRALDQDLARLEAA